MSGLKFTFVDIDGTIGMPQESTYADFSWLDVDFESEFALKSLDGASMEDFVQRLEADADLARKYELLRIGADPTNDLLVQDALDYYQYNGLIRQDATIKDAFTKPEDFSKTACMMRSAKNTETLDVCLAEAASAQKSNDWANIYLF